MKTNRAGSSSRFRAAIFVPFHHRGSVQFRFHESFSKWIIRYFRNFILSKGILALASRESLQSTLQRKSTSVFASRNLDRIFIRRLISLKSSTEAQCLKLFFTCKEREGIGGLYIRRLSDQTRSDTTCCFFTASLFRGKRHITFQCNFEDHLECIEEYFTYETSEFFYVKNYNRTIRRLIKNYGVEF